MNLLTRRFPTILGLLLLIIGGFLAWQYIQKSSPQIVAETAPDKVKITNTADNKFTVSWVTQTTTEGYVEYGIVGEKLDSIANDDRDSIDVVGKFTTHHVTVENLQPQTQYAFRIVSGETKTKYDNNGSPYAVTTGPTIAQTPTAQSLYGTVKTAGGETATGSIVYLTLPGAEPASTLVTTNANYAFAISTIRTSNLQQYIEYDSQATVAEVLVESGQGMSKVTVSTANSQPVPNIVVGQNADYRSGEVPPVAQVEPNLVPSPIPSPTPSATAAAVPGIFNVEPLNNGIQRTGETEVIILNPEKDGEQVATTRPEIRGTAPGATVLSITIRSTTPYTGSIIVEDDGTWSWAPPGDLEPGEHTITIAYIDEAGKEKKLLRKFFVSSVLAAEGGPAFVSTPSGSLAQRSPSPTPSPSPSPKPSPKASPVVAYSPLPSSSTTAIFSPSPREVIPSTESGVPVTGVITPTLLTGALGFVIMVLGALLLAL